MVHLPYDTSSIDLEDPLVFEANDNDDDFVFPKSRAKHDAPPSNLEVALRLGNAGLYVHPCNAHKAPTIEWGKEADNKGAGSSCNLNVIEAWWRVRRDAIPGINTGKNKLLVIDCDRKPGAPDGVNAFWELAACHGGVPEGCPIVSTPSGGRHVYLMIPEGMVLGNGTGALPSGIDVRGVGGQVVAPGAHLPDGRAWEHVGGSPDLAEAYSAGTIPVAPQWLIDILLASRNREEAPDRESTPQHNAGSWQSAGARERAFAQTKLAAKVAELAQEPKGARNNTLNAVAFALGRQVGAGRLGEAEVRTALIDACKANGSWQEDARECRRSIDGALAKGISTPAPPLADRGVSENFKDAEAEEIGNMLAEGNIRRAKQRERVFVDGDEIDPETGEIIGEAPSASDARHGSAAGAAEEPPHAEDAPRQNGGAKKCVEIEIVVASSFAGKPVPPQEWLVQDLIPADNVTLLMGDGGTGKSLLGLQLGVATATGGPWIGFRPKAGSVLFVSAEDEIEELHRRLARMCPRLEMLDNLAIIPLAGKDAVLAAPEGREGFLKETPLFVAIRHIIAKHRPGLLILDTLADLFGGDEIKKVQARQFIGLLRGLALEYHVTVLLLGHPSQSGMSSGTGESGSKGWNNSARSRLYLERRITKEGLKSVEDDVNIRVLKTMKSNRATIGGQIVLKYDRGMFVREEASTMNARDANHQADIVFMELLAQFERENRTVSDRSGANYAPFVFSKHPNANGVEKGQLEKAMHRLFGADRIKVIETGPLSRRLRKIAITDPASDDTPDTENEIPIDGTFEHPPDDADEGSE